MNPLKMNILRSLFAVFITLSFISVSAQNADTITVKQGLATTFVKGGRNLTPAQLMTVTSGNKEALAEMKIAKSNYTVASVFGGIGGALIGWPLGTAVAGGKPNWGMALVGGALVAISIPFNSAYVSHTKRAVRLYNDGIKSGITPASNMKLSFTPNGAGLQFNF